MTKGSRPLGMRLSVSQADRQAVCLSLSQSLSLSVCQSVSQSVCWSGQSFMICESMSELSLPIRQLDSQSKQLLVIVYPALPDCYEPLNRRSRQMIRSIFDGINSMPVKGKPVVC